ncbi:MAG: hypothetical protein RI965_1514 [Bacteroidota bacterium]|jgi:hypothetical protein
MNSSFITKLTNIFHPERFQGWDKQFQYFEGWYFKLVNQSGNQAIAVIPGIAMDEQGNKQAFIQILDGKRKTAQYHKFPFESFTASKNAFEISIGENHFSSHSMQLNIENIQGCLRFNGNITWPKYLLSPGIMGPYSFVPYMECYHGIVSMNHQIEGSLMLNGNSINFTNGKGYLEKDWGKSFPSSYIWLQSNHFLEEAVSLKCSVAKIPWLGSSFVGFIAGLWWKNKFIRFTTYNRSKLVKAFANLEYVEIEMENPRYHLEIIAVRDAPTALASPILGLMDGRIEETMNATIHIKLSERRSGKILYMDKGKHGGLEVAGNVEELFTGS